MSEEQQQAAPIVDNDEEQQKTAPVVDNDGEQQQAAPIVDSDEEQQKTVLIVDNDEEMRNVMGTVVLKMGHRALAVGRATRAVPIIEKGVDAVLLDLHMPGPHGDHLLSYLKSNKIPIPPTIVVSGYLDREVVGPLAKLGVSGIIAKPFEVRRLMDELGRVLEGREEDRMAFCPACGCTPRVDDRFCRKCGVSLERMYHCPQCETPYAPGNRFCGNCGAQLAGEEG